MEFVEFVNERERMCNNYKECVYCGFYRYIGKQVSPCDIWCLDNPLKAQEIVEKWSKENSAKTRKMDFLERCPSAKIDNLGVPNACVEEIYGIDINCDNTNCVKCWNTPIEE